MQCDAGVVVIQSGASDHKRDGTGGTIVALWGRSESKVYSKVGDGQVKMCCLTVGDGR